MTKTLSLFCLISGELSSDAFLVNISSDETIDQLKKLIKFKKSPEFDDIAANNLTAWCVMIPVAEDAEDEIFTIDKVDAKRLLKGKETLSEAFKSGVPEDTIHIIIERPKDMLKALESEKEKAKLWKEIKDLRGTENIVVLKVILRPSRSDYFPWTTDTETASIKELLRSIYFQYPDREDGNAVLTIVHAHGTPHYEGGGTKRPKDDEQFREIIRRHLKANIRTIVVALEMPTKKYADFTLTEVNSLYAISNMDVPFISDLPRFNGISTEALDSDLHKESLRRLLDEIDSRIRAMPSSGDEATSSAYTCSFLTQAIMIFERTLILVPKRAIEGRYGHGEVDYSIEAIPVGDITRNFGVTVVKNNDFKKGLAQNMVQLESSLTIRKRKWWNGDDRKREEDGSIPMKAYGIVTNASVWYFVECSIGYVSSADPDCAKFRIANLSSNVNYNVSTWRKDVAEVLGQIVWLIRKMVSEIPKRELKHK
ncbi:hypothetical protein BGZ51_007221 [Haplosporangium sp. Z 767]|nr:hypothetical protein BGZ51_007221 [Haplosporangium sp. Z 767]KAF9193674.1 hypothetical protein BGZ50_007250 [Haplosporangium sp. Z 11]